MFRVYLVVIFCLVFKISIAGGPPQPPGSGGNGNAGGNGNGNGNPGGGTCWPPQQCVPIDGGLFYLLIGGAAYGLYNINKIKTLKNKSEKS